MKITLIKPTIGTKGQNLYVDEGRMEPLMLGVIAGLTPDDVEVVLYDDRMEKIPYDDKTDLVAITVETYTARRAYEISGEYKKRGVPVIMGGMHVTLLPEEVSAHADSIFIGDAETLWHQVIRDVREGRLKKRYIAKPGIGQQNGILPRRDLFKNKGYLPISLMQFTRGCRYECNFCAVSQYFEKNHYIRQIDEVIKEISEQERKLIFFVDDNIATDKKALKDLCRELIPLKIRWVSQASLDVTKDLEAMKLLKDSGCIGNVMGFESINPDSLKDAKKSFNMKGGNYQREIKILRDHAMQTWAAFTLGYDSDTKDSVMATMDFAIKNKFTFAAFNILVPYPNTPLYKKLEGENRLLFDGKWWDHPDYKFNHAAFIPKNMTPDELTNVCFEARKKFNTIPSILYRFSDIRTNLKSLWTAITFLKYANLTRREIDKKQSIKLGLK